MPFDASVRPVPSEVRTKSTAAAPLIPNAEPGDVVFAPEVFRHECLLIDGSDLQVHTLSASRITVSGQDLETKLLEAETDRLAPSALTDSNFVAGAITGDKLGAPLPVYLGGTGVDTSSGREGMLAVGGGADALSFTPGLSWSNDDAALSVERAVGLGEFSVSASNGSLVLSGPGVAVDLVDYRLGVPPVAAVSEPAPGASDSNAFIDYSVTDGDSDALFLHLSWYALGSDRPRLPREVARGDGALSNATLDLLESGPAGAFTIGGLDPISEYVVRATAEDARGNLSGVHPITVRTTEFGSPVVSGIHTYVTDPTFVGFSSSNQPDPSDMLFVSGVLTSAAPAVTEADIDANLDKFYSRTIAPGEHLDIAATFHEAHDPADAFSAEPIAEARTYHPFVFYRDAESNAVVQYGAPLYNPDVTPPAFDAGPAFVSSTAASIAVSQSISDAVGVAEARAYVSLLDASLDPVTVPTAGEVLAHGDAVSPSGVSTILNYHSGDNAAKPLLDTARYRVYVAAADAAGLTAQGSVDARTLDGAPPVVDLLTVRGDEGTSNAVVSWETSDAGPHASVTAVHVQCTSSAVAPTADQVRDSATGSFSLANSSAVFGNVPAHLDTRVYAVAEDDAAAFGNPENRLSAVAQGAILAPSVAVGPAYSQLPGGTTVEMASVADGIQAESGPVNVRMVLFNATDPSPELGPAESNAVFAEDVPSAVLGDLLLGAEWAAEALDV